MNVLVIFLSYRCNNNCQFCIQTDILRDASLDRKFLISILDNLIANIDRIIISGGEPFLNKDLNEILNYLKKK